MSVNKLLEEIKINEQDSIKSMFNKYDDKYVYRY